MSRLIPDEELLEDLHRVARRYLDVREKSYRLTGRYGTATFYTRFGTWRRALVAASQYKESGILLKAAKAALASHHQNNMRSARIAEKELRAEVPFMRWTDAQVRKRWPGRLYGEIPQKARQK